MYSEQDFLEDPELLSMDKEALAQTAYNKGILEGMRRMVKEAELFDDYDYAFALREELRYIYESEKEFIE